jgi:hypothetical protein
MQTWDGPLMVAFGVMIGTKTVVGALQNPGQLTLKVIEPGPTLPH